MRSIVLTFIVVFTLPFLSVTESKSALSDDLAFIQDYTFENSQYTQSEYETKLTEIKKKTELYNRLFNYAVAFVIFVVTFAVFVFLKVYGVFSFLKQFYVKKKSEIFKSNGFKTFKQ